MGEVITRMVWDDGALESFAPCNTNICIDAHLLLFKSGRY